MGQGGHPQQSCHFRAPKGHPVNFTGAFFASALASDKQDTVQPDTRMRRSIKFITKDPYEAAKLAGLHYSSPEGVGLRRRKVGKGFAYLDQNGIGVRDRKVLRRIRSLVIPPAWTDVWISADEASHLQAVGRDARGRKQYRYHPLYRQIRDQHKFERLMAFGKALPALRQVVEKDLALPGMPRRKLLAIITRLLETTCIRVGNEEYVRENNSFGLTTLKNKHVSIMGQELRFRFRGKSGQLHDIALRDSRLARLIKKCQCIPGYELFRYLDEDGMPESVDSADVNEYLREALQGDFTAKDFRTWVGSWMAARILYDRGPATSETAAKQTVADVVKQVAAKLGNRPATCRAYYIHPLVLSSFQDGTLFEIYTPSGLGESPINGLSPEEQALLTLLARIPQPVERPPRAIQRRSRRRVPKVPGLAVSVQAALA